MTSPESDYEDALPEEREITPDELLCAFIVGGALGFGGYFFYCYFIPV